MGLFTRRYLVTCISTIVVEAGSEEQAQEFAAEELHLRGPYTEDFQVEEIEE